MPLTDAAPMLQGVKVVDLTSVVFGPYCTQILSDFGADVVKVEPPTGDAFRYSQRPAHSKGMSPGHLSLNRGKKSVALNLKQKPDNDIIKNMIRDADIFIHNVRAKAIQRLGLGYEDMRKLNPEIIYVHCVGFGSTGPYADLQAYDDVIQSATGTTSLIGRVDGDSKPRFIPSLIADKVAGLNAAYATLAAVVHKLRTKRGQFVEVPMFEAFTHFMLKEHLAGKTFVPPNGSACYGRQVDPYRQPFETSDGHIVIVPYTLDSWDAVYAALGNSSFLEDAKFSTQRERMKNQDALYEGVAACTPSKTTEEWLAIFRGLNIPCMPVRDIDDVLEDPHLTETGFFQQREHPSEGTFYEMQEASKFSDWLPQRPAPAPHIGQHTDEVRSRYQNK